VGDLKTSTVGVQALSVYQAVQVLTSKTELYVQFTDNSSQKCNLQHADSSTLVHLSQFTTYAMASS
jgi:D-Tyr-tRNAtyr deacylase